MSRGVVFMLIRAIPFGPIFGGHPKPAKIRSTVWAPVLIKVQSIVILSLGDHPG